MFGRTPLPGLRAACERVLRRPVGANEPAGETVFAAVNALVERIEALEARTCRCSVSQDLIDRAGGCPH